MSNTYREPTEAETEAYKSAIATALKDPAVDPQKAAPVVKAAIESVFGPCTYEYVDRVYNQVTQRTPGETGALVRFLINCHLDRV